ncbi:MAG: hypothetical protein A2X55_04755 [Nitrospirae bacterium GWB2_47_37]|nr:MAG: hypothetical protein A2X55_04755 [Nitrospirae bacterium GWB2_47_37]HAK89648.1 acyl carrier protein [Nitrospiraceae bacterium]
MQTIAIVRDIIRKISGVDLDDDDPLIMTHRIDSMDIIEIVSALEQEFNIIIESEDIIMSNFDTVKKMSSYVSRKIFNDGRL